MENSLKNAPIKRAVLAELGNGIRVIKVTFPFNNTTLNQIRTLKDRYYHPTQQCWTCPTSVENIEKLQNWGFEVGDSLLKMIEQTKVRVNNNIKIIPIPGLKGELYPFQKLGVSFVESRNGRALIADEMGLGKTVQAIGWLQLHPEIRPAIIIVPSSLKINWLKEILKWMTCPNAEILCGEKPYTVYSKILIINYDILAYWKDYLKSINAKILVFDEAHNIKNTNAKKTDAAKKLADGIPHVIALTGTPVLNRPIEIYNIISIINPTLFASYWQFVNRYCGVTRNQYGMQVNGHSNTQELHEKLVDSIMIRRLKKDVMKDLPDKKTAVVPIEIDNWPEYSFAEEELIEYLVKFKSVEAAIKAMKAEGLVKINTLKQIAMRGKMKGVINWIQEFLESDEKLVVFCTHKEAIDILMNAFPKIAVRYDGTLNETQRDKNVVAFQNNPNIKLFFGMLDAKGNPAGVGLTLTAASNTCTIEFLWTPGIHDQADDRVHRIGQKYAVTNYKLVAAGTIDERLMRILEKKSKIVNSITDGKPITGNSVFDELMNEYLKLGNNKNKSKNDKSLNTSLWD